MKRPENITSADWQLLQAKYKNLEPIVKKIDIGYPVQYLIGNVDFYGYMVPSTGYLDSFDIIRYEKGFLLKTTKHYVSLS